MNKEQTPVSPLCTIKGNRSVAHDSIYIIYQAVSFLLLSLKGTQRVRFFGSVRKGEGVFVSCVSTCLHFGCFSSVRRGPLAWSGWVWGMRLSHEWRSKTKFSLWAGQQTVSQIQIDWPGWIHHRQHLLFKGHEGTTEAPHTRTNGKGMTCVKCGSNQVTYAGSHYVCDLCGLRWRK